MRLIDADEAKVQIRRLQVLKPSGKSLLMLALDRTPTYEPPNDPLTLDELREMGGEPVWVKVSENWRESGVKDGWRLVRLHKSDDRLRLYFYDTHFGPTFVAEQNYVQSWIAYRRKPEGGI